MPVHTPRVSTSWLCLLVERVSKRPRSQLPIPPQQPHAPTAGRSNCPSLVCYLPLVLCPSLVCYLSTARLLRTRTHRASPLTALVRMPTQVSIHYAFRHSVRITAAATTHVLKLTGLGLGLGSGLGLGLGPGLELGLGLGLGLAHNPSPNPNQVGTTCPRWTRTCSPPTSRTGARAYGRRSHYRL